MVDDAIIAQLPIEIAARVQSATLADGVAKVVIDVSGLEADQRAALERAVSEGVARHPDVSDVRVAMTAERVQRRIIAIGSGKGGVGKSTLTANLAVALARLGHKVGVVDADIYGPSQPVLLGNAGGRPVAEGGKLVPVASAHGVPVLSMGHLAEPGKAIAWRGPMVGNALGQMIDAHWGEVDLLLVDLPPGTGDVQLSMLQKHKPAGAVIVSTPQDLALIDARRAAQLFETAGVPIVGLVENMSGYACPHCGEISDPFGRGGVASAADELGVPLIGRIPLELAIREASDAGEPPAARQGEAGAPFRDVAEKLSAWLAS